MQSWRIFSKFSINCLKKRIPDKFVGISTIWKKLIMKKMLIPKIKLTVPLLNNCFSPWLHMACFFVCFFIRRNKSYSIHCFINKIILKNVKYTEKILLKSWASLINQECQSLLIPMFDQGQFQRSSFKVYLNSLNFKYILKNQ